MKQSTLHYPLRYTGLDVVQGTLGPVGNLSCLYLGRNPSSRGADGRQETRATGQQ
jgi:hypothetical protein